MVKVDLTEFEIRILCRLMNDHIEMFNIYEATRKEFQLIWDKLSAVISEEESDD